MLCNCQKDFKSYRKFVETDRKLSRTVRKLHKISRVDKISINTSKTLFN